MISVRLLGAVEVRDGAGGSFTELLQRPKRLAVLAYLAAAQPYGFHRRDKLLGLFWADATQRRARKALNQALFILRSELGADVVRSRGDEEVALNDQVCSVDVRAFDQAVGAGEFEPALQWYKGEFLEGFCCSGASEFERWADQERTRLRQSATKSTFALIERYQAAGDYLAAVERARWATRIAPADENLFRTLLRLLDQHGDRASALREYEGFARRLAQDYGLDPSPETRALVERIRARQTPVALESGREGPAGHAPGGRAPGAAASDAAPVTSEDRLRRRLTAALAGRYAIEREIGFGGMSVVFLARDVKHGRDVAVKALRPELAESIAADRFLHEIRIAASLEHPNIVPIYDSGDADGLPYYVMRYCKDGSLRERLQRESQLSLEDALGIVADVADGLDAAHRQGVIHRDIKPANILFADGRAVVSDFGVARALTEAGAVSFTVTGVAIGTPGYMSPEQATGDPALDARSDQYSLACVLYESLAGEMVFTGPSARAIIAKHVTLPPPPVSAVRPAAAALERVISRALAKIPADRYADVRRFARALEQAKEQTPVGPFTLRSLLLALGGVAIVAAASWTIAQLVGAGARGGGAPRDTTHYAILPFQHREPVRAQLNEIERLQDALSRWKGLTIVDPMDVRRALRDEASLAGRAPAIARGLRAGHYLWGEVAQVGDSLRIRTALYRTADATLLADHAIRISSDLALADSLFARAVDHLLFRGSPPEDAPGEATTRSLPARQAFADGQRALFEWELGRADSAFARATRFDPGYAQAHLWIALVRAWSGAEAARWRIAAEQAALGQGRMDGRDAAMTGAVLAQARGDMPAACRVWRSVTDRAPEAFAAWYGLAHCLYNDSAVLPDGTSPSGWRFRTSYHRALLAYRRAFELRPSVLASFRADSYRPLRSLFRTAGQERGGLGALPDTNTYVARPTWLSDSLAFVPYPVARVQTLAPGPRPARGANEAMQYLRGLFHDVANAWVASQPENGDGMEALAISLALLGNPAALDTLGRARDLFRDPRDRFRVAAAEVWMQLAFALPRNLAGVQRARHLADSLLVRQAAANAGDPVILSGLAALTGRANAAAAYAVHPGAAAASRAHDQLKTSAPALVVYAALGGPEDSLRLLERRVRAVIEQRLLPTDRAAARGRWLTYAATLAFPAYRFDDLGRLAEGGDYLLGLQAALADDDTLAIRTGIEHLRTIRKGFHPASLTFDALYPEAELLVALGDWRAAAEWLDPTLLALPQVEPQSLARPEVAASLVRTAALRAKLAWRMGDGPQARQWAASVVTLWSDADPFLQALVAELRRMGV